ncbi:MAG: DUF302 domain-containing protein [Acetobacteraceae bacterium]
MAPDGMVALSSGFGPKETMERLAAAVTSRGMTIFARVDHAGAAAKVGLELPPTEVLIFGNPKVGTPLMQAAQTIAIDLPLRALVWEDGNGQTWLAYNDPTWLAKRHGADRGTARTLDGMADALMQIAQEVAGPEAKRLA